RTSPARGPFVGMWRTPSSSPATSSVALSPSSVKSASPARTGAPSALSQPTKTPFSMFQPSRGTVIGFAMVLFSLRDQIANRLGNRLGIRNDGALQRGTVGRGHVDTIEAPNRRVEVVEANVADLSGDFRADAIPRERFVHDEQPSCLANGSGNRCDVERRHGPRIDQLHRNAFPGQ